MTQNQGNEWSEAWDFGNNGNQNFGLITDPGNNHGDMEVAFTPRDGGEHDSSHEQRLSQWSGAITRFGVTYE